MAGESHLMEQAKKQWEKLNARDRKIINGLLMTEAERIEWPENTKPKFSNATATSAYQKEQQNTDYEPNMLEITTVHRPIIT